MDPLPSNHFLSQVRPDIIIGPPAGLVDTSTLAAHDFDVDNRTGFMPPQPPLSRLSAQWDSWEEALDRATTQKLQLAEKLGLSEAEAQQSALWRADVRQLPILPITDLKKSEVALRRAHHVLAWIMHFYVHTLPIHEPITIPIPITLPLLQVCAQLQLPPVLTYSDDVLYNWALRTPSSDPVPALDNLRCQTLFTGTIDEEEFYLSSTRIELRGVEALELMRDTMDEAFVGDDIAIRRITTYLTRMSSVIKELKVLLMSVRNGCDPDVFYRNIRPWFRGADSDTNGRPWVFEGIDQDPSLEIPTELSGASAGQSSLIHALDIFLGVGSASTNALLRRMQTYMPRHHRSFLRHLTSNPRPLRAIVSSSDDPKLLEAYNAAVLSLKEFRDAHMIIVALYVLGPKRRAAAELKAAQDKSTVVELVGTERAPVKGTGGTDLVRFLKDVRNLTAEAILEAVNPLS